MPVLMKKNIKGKATESDHYRKKPIFRIEVNLQCLSAYVLFLNIFSYDILSSITSKRKQTINIGPKYLQFFGFLVWL
jgi:hypothetical protein